MLLAKRGLGVIEADLARAAEAAAGLADAHRTSIMIGRTLLQQAVPVTFGLVAAGWLTSLDEARDGLAAVASQRLAVQFGGAAGTLASLGAGGPAGRGAARRGTRPGRCPCCPGIPTGCGSSTWAPPWPGLAAALGKIARDVTLLAQTEVGEVSEGTPSAQPATSSQEAAASAAGRVLGDAAQAQPGRGDRHPRLHQAGPRAARDPGRRPPSRNCSARPAPGTPSGSR